MRILHFLQSWGGGAVLPIQVPVCARAGALGGPHSSASYEILGELQPSLGFSEEAAPGRGPRGPEGPLCGGYPVLSTGDPKALKNEKARPLEASTPGKDILLKGHQCDTMVDSIPQSRS